MDHFNSARANCYLRQCGKLYHGFIEQSRRSETETPSARNGPKWRMLKYFTTICTTQEQMFSLNRESAPSGAYNKHLSVLAFFSHTQFASISAEYSAAQSFSYELI